MQIGALGDIHGAFDAVADLCEMSARQDPALKRLADGGAAHFAEVVRAIHAG